MSSDTTDGEIQQPLVVAVEWGWLCAAGGYGQRRSESTAQPGLVRLRGPAGAEKTRWVPSGGGQNPAYKNSQKMSARKQSDVQMRTAATIARARASTQSASNIRQTMAEQQRKIAAMSQKERQQLMEKVQTQAKAALVRTQARNSNRPVRDYVMKAPQSGLPHSTHTAGVYHRRQPSNSTQSVQPANAAVRAQHSLLMSTDSRLQKGVLRYAVSTWLAITANRPTGNYSVPRESGGCYEGQGP